MTARGSFAIFIMLASLCAGRAPGQWTEIADFRWPDWPDRDFPSPVISIALIDSNIFAGTMSRGIFLSRDAGKTWNPSETGMTDPLCDLLEVGGKVYAGTQYKGVVLSVDTGKSWAPMNNGLTNPWVLALTHKDGMLFASTPSGVFRSSDGGMLWEEANDGIIVKRIERLATSATAVYAGAYRALYRSSDLGASWQRADSGLGNRLVRALGACGEMVFAGTDSGIYRSSDEGRRWTAVNNGLTTLHMKRFAAAGMNVFAGAGTSPGLRGSLYLSTDLGTDWKIIDDNFSYPENGIYSIATDEHFVYIGTGGYKLWRRQLEELISSLENPGEEPESGSLILRNYPNPARGCATISFTLKRRTSVSMNFYDVRGIEVLSWPQQHLEAGSHERKLSLPGGMRGVYICVLSADRVVKSRALIMH